jgi:hypothetical protein
MNKWRVVKLIFVFLIFLGLILYCAGGLVVSYDYHGNLPEPCRNCYLRTGRYKCSMNTQCIISYGNGKRECYCCPVCGFPQRQWLINHGYRIQKTLVTDYETEKLITATSAYYLIDSRIHGCCSPSVVAFQTKPQAERFQQIYGGTISHLSQ